MSAFDFDYLNENVLVGFVKARGEAWWAANGDATQSHYDGPVPFDEAERMLDWNPVREPLNYSYYNGVTPVQLIHPESGVLLGVHTDAYSETNYSQRLLEGLSAILDDDLGTSIGSVALLDGGGKAVVQIETPETIVHSSGESFRPWLAAYSSLDGTLATTFKEGVTRIVCDNTFEMFRAEKGKSYKYKNTAGSTLRVATARECLDLLNKISDDMIAEMDELINTEVSPEQWTEILNVIVPVPHQGRGRTRALNTHLKIETIYETDTRVKDFKGTKWGAFQAFSTHKQHETTVQEGENEYQRNLRWTLRGQSFNYEAEVMEGINKVLQSA